MQTINGVALDPFTLAYCACALWASVDEDGSPIDRKYTIQDIAPEALQSMARDCADFQSSFTELLRQSGLSDDQAGHDFLLTRNGHGAGFWDRGIGKIGEELSAMARPYGNTDLYAGDNGKLYISPL